MFRLLIAAAALSAVAPAIAAPEVAPRIHVRVADLDLRTPAGIKTLDRRIEQAARDVCPGFWNGDLPRRAPADKCHKLALAGAMDQRGRALANAAERGVATASVVVAQPISSTN